MMEIWKPVKGFENYYEVSNLGRVKSLPRICTMTGNSNHATQQLKGKLLKPSTSGSYASVALCKNGKVYCRTLHRIVAEAFIPNPDNLPCVNHKDLDKHNNCVDNLEWCTYQYNNLYAERVEKCKTKISTTLKGRKRVKPLTDEQRRHISEGAKKGWETRRKNLKSVIEEEEIIND